MFRLETNLVSDTIRSESRCTPVVEQQGVESRKFQFNELRTTRASKIKGCGGSRSVAENKNGRLVGHVSPFIKR